MHSRSRLYKPRANLAGVTAMSWRDFERLIGEAFRRRGFTLTGFGGGGPNGSVDLALVKNGHRYLVQCKHWRKPQVGVSVVRELNGVLVAIGAHKAFAVTGGEFTREARDFAKKTEVELIDGEGLEELIRGVDSPSAERRTGILKIA
jgi:restriction system protein